MHTVKNRLLLSCDSLLQPRIGHGALIIRAEPIPANNSRELGSTISQPQFDKEMLQLGFTAVAVSWLRACIDAVAVGCQLVGQLLKTLPLCLPYSACLPLLFSG